MLHPDFKEFLELLNEQQVKYLVVGGYALNLYIAKPRLRVTWIFGLK